MEKNHYFNRNGEESFIDIFFRDDLKNGEDFPKHWHEHLQIYYFIDGKALIQCGNNTFQVHPEDIILVNSGESHYLKSKSDNLAFFIIRFEPNFIYSNKADIIQTKYLAPIINDGIIFDNYIENDDKFHELVKEALSEYFNKELGYELSIKGIVYNLIVLLLRNHIHYLLTEEEFRKRKANLQRFSSVFEYIEKHYLEKITLNDLSNRASISKHHFCRIFKELTGKTAIEYINGIRLEKAVDLLNETDNNITEIALKCGFENINYFSRVFKSQYRISPSQFRKCKYRSSY